MESKQSSVSATSDNRCDRPGCISRVTKMYLVGLGGFPAFYCHQHAPVVEVASNQEENDE
jgi:hypothetical protein